MFEFFIVYVLCLNKIILNFLDLIFENNTKLILGYGIRFCLKTYAKLIDLNWL